MTRSTTNLPPMASPGRGTLELSGPESPLCDIVALTIPGRGALLN
jgi:hypothetical protein